MQESEFEKKVQQKMDELKFVPADAVWDKIEAELPEKERRRRRVFFLLLFVSLLTASLLWLRPGSGNKNTVKKTITKENIIKADSTQTAAAGLQSSSKEIAQTATDKTSESTKKSAANESGIAQNGITGTAIKKTAVKDMLTGVTAIKKIRTVAYNKMKIKSGSSAAAVDEAVEAITSSGNKKSTSKARTKITVVSPQGKISDDDREKIAGSITDTVAVIVENSIVRDSLNVTIKKDTGDSLAVTGNDTAQKKTNGKEKKQHQKWSYGIDFTAGNSIVQNGLFSNDPVYNPVFAGLSTNPPTSSITVSQQPNNPLAAVAISAGFYMKKNMSKKWLFKTGLNYMYQSNKVKTGEWVDTARSFTSGSSATTVYVNNYYRSGNSFEHTNQFHLLELPLMFEYKLSEKLPLYMEAGPTVSYLLGSNALVYNSTTGYYFTSNKLFDKLLVSFRAGVGFDIAKRSKMPFSIGYQFKYGINSIVKSAFAQQHFVNSLIYLKVPLKK